MKKRNRNRGKVNVQGAGADPATIKSTPKSFRCGNHLIHAFVVGALAAVTVPSVVWAQTSESTLRGQAPPNATVTARNLATGAVRRTTAAAMAVTCWSGCRQALIGSTRAVPLRTSPWQWLRLKPTIWIRRSRKCRLLAPACRKYAPLKSPPTFQSARSRRSPRSREISSSSPIRFLACSSILIRTATRRYAAVASWMSESMSTSTG